MEFLGVPSSFPTPGQLGEKGPVASDFFAATNCFSMPAAAPAALPPICCRLCPADASSRSTFRKTCHSPPANTCNLNSASELRWSPPTCWTSRSPRLSTASSAPRHSTGCSITSVYFAACFSRSVQEAGCRRSAVGVPTWLAWERMAARAFPRICAVPGELPSPWLFQNAEDAAKMLQRAGFVDVQTNLEAAPTLLDDRRHYMEFLKTVIVRTHLERIPENRTCARNMSPNWPTRPRGRSSFYVGLLAAQPQREKTISLVPSFWELVHHFCGRLMLRAA